MQTGGCCGIWWLCTKANIKTGSERSVWKCMKLLVWNWIHTPSLFTGGTHHVTKKRGLLMCSLRMVKICTSWHEANHFLLTAQICQKFFCCCTVYSSIEARTTYEDVSKDWGALYQFLFFSGVLCPHVYKHAQAILLHNTWSSQTWWEIFSLFRKTVELLNEKPILFSHLFDIWKPLQGAKMHTQWTFVSFKQGKQKQMV